MKVDFDGTIVPARAPRPTSSRPAPAPTSTRSTASCSPAHSAEGQGDRSLVMATHKIAVLAGDGIGPEVTAEARKVLQVVGKATGASFEFERGAGRRRRHRRHRRRRCRRRPSSCASRATPSCSGRSAARSGTTSARRCGPSAGSCASARSSTSSRTCGPATCFPMLVDASPLKRSVVEGTDLMVIRELTGGLYFGEPRGREKDRRRAASARSTPWPTPRARSSGSRASAFDVACKRRKKLASVDKANVLIVSQLWRDVVNRVAEDYPDGRARAHPRRQLRDGAGASSPTRFDTIVTENTFGDILSDEAAILAGSMGMLPSASHRRRRSALYEPVHGTAPDIAGKGDRQPDRGDPVRGACCCATRWTAGRDADRIDARGAARARAGAPDGGHRRARLGGPWRTMGEAIGTTEMGDLIARGGGGELLNGARRARWRWSERRARSGQTTLKILEERKFPVRELRAFASERSVGKTVTFAGESIAVEKVEPGAFKGIDIALLLGGLGAVEGVRAAAPCRPARSSSTSRTRSGWTRRCRSWCPRSTPHAAPGPPGHRRVPELHHDRHRDAAQAAPRRRAPPPRRRHELPGGVGRGRQRRRGAARADAGVGARRDRPAALLPAPDRLQRDPAHRPRSATTATPARR